MEPAKAVKVTTAWVMQEATHVSIDSKALKSLADDLWQHCRSHEPPSWKEGNWHYYEDVHANGERTLLYILILDSLNFCFWPVEGLQYEHLACGLTKAFKEEPELFTAEKLSRISAAQLEPWFAPFQVPQLEERVEKVREVGKVLLRHFQGSARHFVQQAEHSAVKLVEMITAFFPGFRDQSVYKGRQIFLYKRAQIAVADMWSAFGRKTLGENIAAFTDIRELTMFADYRVPQLLEARNVLRYSTALNKNIDEGLEISPGSEEEIEIRAATIQAVEGIVACLDKQSEQETTAMDEWRKWTAVELDWLLWNMGEQEKEKLRPHHRTLTVFY